LTLVVGNRYQIRISDASNFSIFDESSYFEIINPINEDAGISGEEGGSHDILIIPIIITIASISTVAILISVSAIILKKKRFK